MNEVILLFSRLQIHDIGKIVVIKFDGMEFLCSFVKCLT